MKLSVSECFRSEGSKSAIGHLDLFSVSLCDQMLKRHWCRSKVIRILQPIIESTVHLVQNSVSFILALKSPESLRLYFILATDRLFMLHLTPNVWYLQRRFCPLVRR